MQLTPLARLVGWARFTRQNASAYWRPDHPQPSNVRGNPTRPALQGSATRALPGTCLFPTSSTLQTPASGAADSCPVDRRARTRAPWGRAAPCARLRGRVRTRRRRPTLGRRPGRAGGRVRTRPRRPTHGAKRPCGATSVARCPAWAEMLRRTLRPVGAAALIKKVLYCS